VRTGLSLLWLTDPWISLDHGHDTTLRLIDEALDLGIPCHWADVRSIAWSASGTTLTTQPVSRSSPSREPASLERGAACEARPSDFSHVFYRVDPPVDLAYLHPLLLLSLDCELRAREPGGCGTEFINSIEVLRGLNEKLAGSFCDGLMPPSLAAADWERLRSFGEREGPVVVKPLHECQSRGVDLLEWTTPSARERSEAVLRALTDDFRRPVLLQRFLPGAYDGETRLWFVDGQLLGQARKRPAQGTFRIDMDRGGSLFAHELDERERACVPTIALELTRAGVRLAAVDLVDGWVTDFNFTSPGLLREMESVVGENLARPLLQALFDRGDGLHDRKRRP